MYKKNSNGRPSRPASAFRGGRRNNSGGGRKSFGAVIDVNKFINKAVVTEPEDEYVPKHKFNDFNIKDVIKRTIASRGYIDPTPIQDQIIPEILAGRDVIGLADTGTGKTAAFLIPIINKILENGRAKAIIITPTRELATQIQDEFVELARGLNIYSISLVGGVNIQRQINQLRSRHNVIIGTPGRLKDLISRKALNLSDFGNVVLDEADRMLDMGFINDVKALLSMLSKNRQTMLFSATLSPEIKNLVNTFLTDPVNVSIKSRETSKNVDQDVVRIAHGEDKIEVLHDLLSQVDFQKVIIFTRTKHGAEKLSKKLVEKGFKSESIHGNKTQVKRQKALDMFKDDYIEILVATDVAARGIDVPNVSHVINFDVPATYDDYIHRIGRTGRANNKGIALTFIG
ncbi:MAG: DEAD/DEAH box helicase [Candidatus Moranbacteria bacterium]|nr:DEAD/DEAH box helicase [Candidatus Moranbacteria bacterium]